MSKLHLIKKIKISNDTFCFHLDKPEGFNFIPGQFIMIKVSNKTDWRAYSICSLPNDPYIAIAVKFVPNGLGSTFLHNLNEEQEIEIKGPMGKFILQDGQNHIFFATGIGITPFIPMITETLKQGRTASLHFGNKTTQDICFHNKFLELKQKYPNTFKYETYITREETLDHKTGRITEHLQNYKLNPNNQYYMCGKQEMIKEIQEILIKKNIPKVSIHKEAFY